jgi:hypothetical protein
MLLIKEYAANELEIEDLSKQYNRNDGVIVAERMESQFV